MGEYRITPSTRSNLASRSPFTYVSDVGVSTPDAPDAVIRVTSP